METSDSIYVKPNGVRLHVVRKGNPDHPAVIFLHGFPEFWYGWRHQIDFFVTQGYQVLIPDLRGYNLSGKPRDIDSYKIDTLAADITGLTRELDLGKVFLTGHDWGGALAWHLAIVYPGFFRKVAVLNCPHPWVLKKGIMSDPKQRRKSWYMFYFQLPILPEMTLGINRFKIVTGLMKKTSIRGTFDDETLNHYVTAWRQKGALRGMLNWYRAMLRHTFDYKPYSKGRVNIPFQLVWGRKDTFLSASMALKSMKYCNDGMLNYIDDATHWVAGERPEMVNRILLDFFNAPET